MDKPDKDSLLRIHEDSAGDRIPFDSFTAASNGDLSYFSKYVVGSTENFSSPNSSGWTPIMYACARGHALLVSYLVMCGVKTNCSSEARVTPLMLAVGSGDLPTVECAFNAADMEREDYRRWTALYYAVHFLQENAVRFLLGKGANVNTQDFQNETPLLIAIKSGNETIVDLLLRTAVNLDVVSYKNESAVMLAKVSGNGKIRESVLARKEHLDRSRGEGAGRATPLGKFLGFDKENRAPSPMHRARHFLGFRISKSFCYSPNKASGAHKLASLCGSPVARDRDSERKSLWRMCVATNPVPSTGQFNVEKLLSSLGLEKYWPVFRDEEVDFETLLTFSEDNLREIGITPFGPRKKILAAIENLRTFYNQ